MSPTKNDIHWRSRSNSVYAQRKASTRKCWDTGILLKQRLTPPQMRFLDSIFSLFQLLVRPTCCAVECVPTRLASSPPAYDNLNVVRGSRFYLRVVRGSREIMIRSRRNRFVHSWTSARPHAGAPAWIYELSGRRIIGGDRRVRRRGHMTAIGNLFSWSARLFIGPSKPLTRQTPLIHF